MPVNMFLHGQVRTSGHDPYDYPGLFHPKIDGDGAAGNAEHGDAHTENTDADGDENSENTDARQADESGPLQMPRLL